MSGLPRASVLYVTYDGLLEPLGASQVVPYVRALRARGFRVELLSFEKPADLVDGRRLAALEAALHAADIPWTRLPYHKRPSVPATAWDVALGRRHVGAWARALRREGRTGIVHARGYLPGLMGLGARRRGGVRLLFDMRGFWVDERIEGGYWRPGSLPVRMGRRVERALLREADHLILLARRAADRLAELSGGAELPPWTVIPTCVDLERFRPPASRAEARAALALGDGPVLLHLGTLTGWYDGPATLAVAHAFLRRCGGRVVILTRDAAEARTLATAAGVEARVASAEPAEVPRWLQAADAGLALVRASPSKDASFPTKIGEYLATGMAVLATPVGDIGALADGTVLGLHRVDGRPAEAVARSAAWLAGAVAHPERAAKARALAQATVGLDAGIDALAGVYAALGVVAEGRGT
jgi:glycosyltransferase involved in cell wall biosynthesis